MGSEGVATVREIFGPRTDFGRMIHAMKYRAPEESFDDYCVRYARTTAGDDERLFRKALHYLREQAILPAGRQQLSVGRPYQTTAVNCFVMGEIPDDTRGIFDAVTESALTLRSGGGIGMDFSSLRPSGDRVKGLGHGAFASGPVSFMNVWHSMCGTIMSAGERRGAMMAVLRVDHPDVLRFARAKQDQRSLTNFNISIAVTDEFMEALEADGLYTLRFGGTDYGTARAQDVWATIMESNFDWAEPGVLFIDRANRLNPLAYCETIYATNPCFTADTRVWTAEGHKTFKELSEVGEAQILTERGDGKLVYRTMRNIRRTQRNARLVRVTMQRTKKGHGVITTQVRCTPEHSFYLRKGGECAAKDLLPGMSIASVYRRAANQKGYKWLSATHDGRMEHHVPFEDIDGLGDEFHVHHINGIKHDNRPENLEVKGAGEHNREHMIGDLNPMRRPLDRTNWRRGDSSGENNGRYRSDVCTEDLQEMRDAGLTRAAIAKIAGCSQYMVAKRLGWKRPVNHRIVSVEILDEQEDVYCGTVDETHRFFVALNDEEGILVHNCGEQFLPPYGACLLGSVNMVKFLVLRPETNGPVLAATGGRQIVRYEIDLETMEDAVDTAVRLFDVVIDRTPFPLEQQKKEAFDKRRMGVGVTGVANALEICGLPYASPEYLNYQDTILERLLVRAYRTSMELAKEKGPFPLWNAEKHMAGEFVRTRLPENLQHEMRAHGLRNGLLTAIAPTGTISLTADNVSSGIEPVFSTHYRRTVLTPEGSREFEIRDYASNFFGVEGQTADQVSGEDHVDVLCRAQHWIDNSISKTVNVAGQIAGTGPGVTFSQFKELYLRAYKGGSKGCATFNLNGKRSGIMQAVAPQQQAEGAACFIDPETGVRLCGD